MKSFCLLVALSCCLAVAFAKTQCEADRERELAIDTEIKLVPKCTPEGEYESLQCFQGSPFCMCWRPDGSQITGPSKDIKTCVCHVHKDKSDAQSLKGMVGQFTPSCNDNGSYAKQQCHGSTGFCWCSDEEGKRISEQVRGTPEC